MFNIFASNLQNRIIFVFVVALLVPAIVTSVYNISSSREALLTSAKLTQIQTTNVNAAAAERLLANPKSDLLFLSQAPQVRRYINNASSGNTATALRDVQSLFQSFLGRTSDLYSKSCLLDASGLEIVCVSVIDGKATVLQPDDLTNRGNDSFFSKTVTLTSNVTNQAPVYISKYSLVKNDDTEIPVLHYASLLQSDDGTIAGVLMVEALLTPIFDLVSQTSADQEVYLVDTDGNYLLNPDSSKLYGNIRGINISLLSEYPNDAEEILSRRDGNLLSSQDQPNSLQAFVRIKPAGQATIQWTLIYKEPLDNILGSIRSTALVIVVITGISLVFAILMTLVLTRAIVRPIKILAKAANDISSGQEDTPLPQVTTQDEIGMLINAFNEMVQQVNTRTQDLRLATARAKEAARVKGEFLANVSHELRTPLNAIIGFSDMLLMGMSGELNPKQRHKMERLKENGVRLLTLINNILDITRIEARRVEIVNKSFAPRALADRLSEQMSVLAERNGLEFKTHIDPQLPETLISDEQRLEQVVVNLLSNAFKFTEKGSVTLDFDVDADGSNWRVIVKDTGIGIPPHALNVIFEEFRQVDGSSSRAFKGSGLGLAITRNLVRIMDGYIAVESELGQGSKFTVTFPLMSREKINIEALEKVEAS